MYDVKKYLVFILGSFIPVLISFYYFTYLIKPSSEFNKLVVNNQIDSLKTTYNKNALRIIELSNTYIQTYY